MKINNFLELFIITALNFLAFLHSANSFAQQSPPQIVNGCEVKDGTKCPNVNWQNQRLGARKLNYANLSGANLSGSILFKAGLAHTDLRNANLSYANLNRANLTGADLRGANIEGATFNRAFLNGTIWVDGRRCAGNPEAVSGWELTGATIFGGSMGVCR